VAQSNSGLSWSRTLTYTRGRLVHIERQHFHNISRIMGKFYFRLGLMAYTFLGERKSEWRQLHFHPHNLQKAQTQTVAISTVILLTSCPWNPWLKRLLVQLQSQWNEPPHTVQHSVTTKERPWYPSGPSDNSSTLFNYTLVCCTRICVVIWSLLARKDWSFIDYI
jgi:hypothetical protein